MLYNLRITIYPFAAILLALASFVLFGRPVLRSPVYVLPDGLVVYSDHPEIHSGDRVVSPECQPVGGSLSVYKCQVSRNGADMSYEVKPVTFQMMDFFRIFYAPFIIAVLMLLSALWFIENGKDFLIATFFLTFTVCILLSMFVIVYETGGLFWTAAGYVLALNFLNLNLRTSGIALSTRILLAESIALSFLLLLLLAAADSPDFHQRSIKLGWSLFWMVFALSFLFHSAAILDPTNDRIERRKRVITFLGFLFGIGMPLALLLLLPAPVPPTVYLTLVALFPLSLFYGTYRMYLVPFQLFVTRGVVAVLLSLSFILIYIAVLYIYSEIIPTGKEGWIVHIVFLSILVFFLDPLRARLTGRVEQKFLIPRGVHSESLKRLAGFITLSTRPRQVVQAMLDEINSTLGIQRSFLLTSPDFFFHLDLREHNVLRLPVTSRIWKSVRPGRMVFASYLNIATGRRRELFELLFHKKIMMAIGLGEGTNPAGRMREFLSRIAFWIGDRWESAKRPIPPQPSVPSCALLIGYPPGRNRLLLHEIRYLQEASRIMGMTLFNIHALIREVDKRRKVREVLKSGQYQKLTMLHPDEPPIMVDYRFFNRPVLSVTGDYIDFIRMDANRVAIFLGDVSGHGLGTGFLVSAVRSIVRTSIANECPLGEVLGYLNEFLSDRYSGYEFLTLFAIILHLQDGSIEYVNAAHPGAFLKLPGEKSEKLENTQRLLGILPGTYRVHSHRVLPGQRIFLFSDGVIETTNRKEEFFGEGRLAEFLFRRGDDPLDEIIVDLKKTLDDFRGSSQQTDDTSFMVVEYLPARSLLDFVMKGLGLRK